MTRKQWLFLLWFTIVSCTVVMSGFTYGILAGAGRYAGVAGVWAVPAVIALAITMVTVSDGDVPEKTPRLSRQARKELKKREDALLLEKKIADAEKELGWR